MISPARVDTKLARYLCTSRQGMRNSHDTGNLVMPKIDSLNALSISRVLVSEVIHDRSQSI